MKKKVLYLITKSNFGGAQRYVYDLATNLDATKYDVAVTAGGKGELIEMLEHANVRVLPLDTLQRDIALTKEIRTFIEIFKILKKEKPDVLHINSSKAGGIGALAGRLSGVPQIIFTGHGWAFNEERPRVQKFLIKFLHWVTVLLSHKTIAVSDVTKAQLNWPLAQRKMCVVHNGKAPIAFEDRETARKKLAEYTPRLTRYTQDTWTGTVAELHPVKRHDIMIEAVHQLVKKGYCLRHIIIGDGELRDVLEKQVHELGLEEHVFFAGYVPEAEKFLKALDIFTLTSRSEALAYALIEAGQACLPVVASRVGGIPEIIEDSVSGLTIEPNNPEAAARALEQLLDDTALRSRLGQQLQNKVSQEFTVAHMLQETVSVYQK